MRPKNFSAKLKSRIEENNAILKSLGGEPLSFREVEKAYLEAGRKLRPFVTNTVVWLHEQLAKKKRILFEGAQGTFLDIDFGTYPFVTSSNTTAGGSCTGSGIPPHRMDRVVGVMKAYTTRVGEGPLPTESAEISDMLHGMGREFGATTGRARRCGWFDAVATRYARMVNGIDELAITNLDGLDTLKQIQICVAYECRGKRLTSPPNDVEELAPLPSDLPQVRRLAKAHLRRAQLQEAPAQRAEIPQGASRANRRPPHDRLRRRPARTNLPRVAAL